MNAAVEYFEKKAEEKNMNHSDLARAAWGSKGENAAINYWKRLRGVAGSKIQRLSYEDMKSLCFALGLDLPRTLFEIEQEEKARGMRR